MTVAVLHLPESGSSWEVGWQWLSNSEDVVIGSGGVYGQTCCGQASRAFKYMVYEE
jgi:hypothetical protein